MKIQKIKIRNYRLLKNFELDLERDLSLVIGKNNSGKTSFLSALDKFLAPKPSANSFSCDDLNLELQKLLKEIIEGTSPTPLPFLGISLKLFIEYDDKDDLTNLSKVIMDLDPANKFVVLSFDYSLPEVSISEFRKHYKEYEGEKIQRFKDARKEDELKEKQKMFFYDFLKEKHQDYFRLQRKTIQYDISKQEEIDDIYIDLDKENIFLDKIINLKVISARRDVSNKDSNKALSVLSSRYYEKKEGLKKDSDAIKDFKDTLSSTDELLNEVYTDLFSGIIDKVEQFGGIKKGDSNITVISTLQHRELLKGNTTVMYDHNEEHALPEHYNGLGYMNLIGIIFEIEVLLSDFRKENKENENPADINLLFIEEPEAHTHPQMQYVFIKNVKNILQTASKGESGKYQTFNLQTIISTHSSHIAAEGQFNDIKYFSRIGKNEVIAKNLKSLEKEYEKDGEKENFKFLKQYLTLNRAELFFADKAVFIEGDTERILLPAMMRKIDQTNPDNPLLSQNISIIEVGAYSHIFEKFINFIGVKSLIITDIDAAIKDSTKCQVDDANAELTTNSSLKYFFTKKEIKFYKTLKLEDKTLKKILDKWQQDKMGHLAIVYQTKEKNAKNEEYHASSFEDSFFHLNRQFVIENEKAFQSLKKIELFKDDKNNPYILAEKCISKKPSFAMEVLLNSKPDKDGNEFSNWQIPGYINEGLLWLQQD